MPGSTRAADVGVAVSMSPDAARVIRDWRRAHGLPQPPEAEEVRVQVRGDTTPGATHIRSGNSGGNPAAALPPRAYSPPPTRNTLPVT
jgi:hypothetical protein